MAAGRVIPYCGLPPSPEQLLGRWNLDPVLAASLAAIAVAYVAGARRAGLGKTQRTWFYGGWGLTAFALICPLCPLSVSLFAARVGQHMVLTLAAAPMVALSRPIEAFAALGRRNGRGGGAGGQAPAATAPLAAGLFAVLLWYWHAPGPYEATFESTLVYWLMHVTLYGSALWLWTALLTGPRTAPVGAVLAGLASTVQMGLLGALITLSPRPVYAPHLLTAYLWGLTPLQDQQIGGALMWVPGCFAFLAAALYELWAALERPAAAPGLARAPVLAPAPR